jgi:hypothetical protein
MAAIKAKQHIPTIFRSFDRIDSPQNPIVGQDPWPSMDTTSFREVNHPSCIYKVSPIEAAWKIPIEHPSNRLNLATPKKPGNVIQAGCWRWRPANDGKPYSEDLRGVAVRALSAGDTQQLADFAGQS